MGFWRFLWTSLKADSKKRSQELAVKEYQKAAAHLEQNPGHQDLFGAHGQMYLSKLPDSYTLAAVTVAGLAGNLLASAIGHFISAQSLDFWAPHNRAWTITGAFSLLVVIQLIRLAYSMYHYNLAMGVAYAQAVGGKMLE